MNELSPQERMFSLQNKAHRDLAWLLYSPSLFETGPIVPAINSMQKQRWFEEAWSWLVQEDQSPAALESFVDTPRK